MRPEFITVLAGLYYNVEDYWVYLEEQPLALNGPYAQAAQELEKLLRLPEPPTALFCFCASFYWHHIERTLQERGLFDS